MSNDQLFGGGVLVLSLAAIVIYFSLLFLSPWAMLTLKLTAFIAVAAVMLIVAWIGYTMATTPPPTPLEDLDMEEMGEEREITP